MHGLEVTALDLVQHRLAGHSQHFRGFGEANPPFRHCRSEPAPDGLVDPDPPGSACGELLTGEEPVSEPPVDGGLPDAEQVLGFRDGDHDRIVV